MRLFKDIYDGEELAEAMADLLAVFEKHPKLNIGVEPYPQEGNSLQGDDPMGIDVGIGSCWIEIGGPDFNLVKAREGYNKTLMTKERLNG